MVEAAALATSVGSVVFTASVEDSVIFVEVAVFAASLGAAETSVGATVLTA